MIPLRLEEVARAVGGDVSEGDEEVTVAGPVVVDSRLVGPGALFVALPGERVDGHDFIEAAAAAGAAAVMCQRPPAGATALPHVHVADGVAALGELARAVVDRLPDLSVVGITGSSGKTSTKDMLSQILARAGSVVAPKGSFNNEIGLPLTALQSTAETRFLVMEMGARGRGHIRYLCEVTPPDVGMVLNVGTAHLGEFGGRDAIAQAKGEMVEALAATGNAILNADDPLVSAMASRTAAVVTTFGESASADVRAESVRLDELGRARFRLWLPSADVLDVELALHGEHQVANALAAAAAAYVLGVPSTAIAGALSEAKSLSPWRMEVTRRADGLTVINDAYNANPDSVRAALKALVSMAGRGRSWAVLGEMGELGEASAQEHDAIGRLAVRLDVDRLVVVGEGARTMHMGAAHEGSWGRESVWVPDTEAAIELLSDELAPGDVVLIKASRSQGLEVVAAAVLAGEGLTQREGDA